MSPRRPGLELAAGVFALLLAAAPASAQQPEASAAALLARLKAATGGERWDRATTVSAAGEKTSFGLKGAYGSAEDLATGRFARRSDYGLLANAEGLDDAGRWRRDNSGGVHPLDSDEARAVAATEAYLARRGYLFPERAGAALTLQDPATEGAETFDRIVVTPQGGRAATLWIRRSDHRLDRAVVALASRIQTVRYRDYRAADGLRSSPRTATSRRPATPASRAIGWTTRRPRRPSADPHPDPRTPVWPAARRSPLRRSAWTR